MSPVKNGRLIFNEYATGYPEPGKTTVYDETATIDLDSVPLNGGVLIKLLVLSIDPYVRFKMSDPKIQKDWPVFALGEPIANHAIGVVLRSQNPDYKPGDHVDGVLPAATYSVLPKSTPLTIIKNEENISWTLYTGVAGMPGMTAYGGWKAFAKAKPGDTIFVTTAAGPVGSTVVQLAKREGLRVIASAGSQQKVDYIKSLGADVTFNYKEQNTKEVLAKEGPINLFWDHVGGEIFDAALENSAVGATFIICGSITGYNSAPHPILRHALIFERGVTIHGFRVFDTIPPYLDSFYKEIPKLIANGELKYREEVTKGLEHAGQALLDVLLGRNEGKSVILVATE